MAGGAQRERGLCKQTEAAVVRALIGAFWMRSRSRFLLCFRIVGTRPNAAFR